MPLDDLLPVNLYLINHAGTGIAEATVQVFSTITELFVTMGQSESNGRVPLLLEPGLYELRFFKNGFYFQNPMRMQVDDSDANTFYIEGTPAGDFGLSSDPRVCRCVLRLVDFSNRPIANVPVRIMPEMSSELRPPFTIEAAIVPIDHMTLHTDSRGSIAVDLVRGATFFVSYTSDTIWKLVVPNQPTVNLSEVLQPHPVISDS